jgi:hypothetical protein
MARARCVRLVECSCSASGLTLSPAPPAELQMGLRLTNDLRVDITAGQEREAGRWHLAVARVTLPCLPKRTSEGGVVVPERERQTARLALETAANIASLGLGCRRELSSPNPYVAFEAQSDEEQVWLAESSELHGGLEGVSNQSIQHRLDLESEEQLSSLSDRWDGVALLSEAITATRATGRFIDFMRLFERAFRMSAPRLEEPLVAFLDQRFCYSSDEVHHWTTTMRGSATHADQRAEFLIEPDVRPYLARVEQAAWDVLMNKLTWRDPTTTRRSVWSPPGGSVSPSGDLTIAVHSTPTLVAQLTDRWEARPRDTRSRACHMVAAAARWDEHGGAAHQRGAARAVVWRLTRPPRQAALTSPTIESSRNSSWFD